MEPPVDSTATDPKAMAGSSPSSDANPTPMKRANYIAAPHYFNLNIACRVLTDAFGHNLYLVGSSLLRRDYRDVDVRCILDDSEFDRMFTKANPTAAHYDPLWSIMSSSISLWLSQHSGLPVDFQFQRQTEANDEHKGMRSAVGIFVNFADNTK